MSLDDLYREVILAHYKRPHNHGELPGADIAIEGKNPACGDELKLQLKLSEGKVSEVRFSGHGCAISQSSASMMTDQLKGKTLDEAFQLAEDFKSMIRGERKAQMPGDLEALRGVTKFPVRVKCATLAWSTLQYAISEQRTSGRLATGYVER
ncbi:MAG: SUF system NifU family Fe-S cluster assembly protein [Deinococcus sp.]|nr:SUF system NifU family Fe-S cluster assembly protein [Deinococcus sp.]